ncbi:MAG: M28 family peptidase, partial [bacterium]
MRQSFLFAALISAVLLTVTETYPRGPLLAIEKGDVARVREILIDEVRLYAILENVCLAGTSPSGVEALDSHKIPYHVVVRDMRPEGYYLATVAPSGYGPDLNSLDGVLYRDRDVSVVEASVSQADALARAGFELVRLVPLAVKDRSQVHREDLTLGKRTSDGFIEKLVREVSRDSLESYLRTLEGFRTRYSYTDSCWSAGQWIYDEFQSFGMDASFHYYDVGPDQWRNVIATIPGKRDSTVIVIICGHFDSISEDPWNLAPGAEDNGSGTAAVIEAARVLSKAEHMYTLRFICFSGEEQGLLGSANYVAEAFGRGDDIAAAMNFDMVGYTDDSHYDILVLYDSISVWLGNLVMTGSRFSESEAHSFRYTSPSSDHWYFQQYGYSATTSFHISRTHGYPYYHTINDTVGNLNPDFLAQVVKMAVASMAMLGNGYPEPPLPPDYVSAVDAGTGGGLKIDWPPSQTPGVLGYNVYYGRSSRRYEEPVYAGDTNSLLLNGLVNGSPYFVSVTAIDDYAEGGYSREAAAVPREIPSPPESLMLKPIYLGMNLSWKPNPELDLAGYNVYRGEQSGGPYDVVNPTLVLDTAYSDSGLASGHAYYYVVTAVDTTDLESAYSEERSSRPLSFDHGILLVDETKNGSVGILVPDSLQDAFYARLLMGYQFDSWDCDSSALPAISTMGMYSTIIWRAEDFYDHFLSEQADDLAYYLSYGGKLWLIGWKAVSALMTSGEYPFSFAPGDWPYDYLRLSSSDNSGSVGLVTARGDGGYPGVSVDSTKVPAGWNGSLILIDTAVPHDSEVVLRFLSDGSDTTFDGQPIATRYLGSEFKVVFFGFPLYYMKESEAGFVVDAVLSDLDEPKGMDEKLEARLRQEGVKLHQSYPNPFSQSTRISVFLGRESLEKGVP